MKILGFVVAFIVGWVLWGGSAEAQITCSTQPAGSSNNACASTAFVNGQVITPPGIAIVVNPYTPPTGFPNAGPGLQVQETVTGTCSTANGAACHYNYINIPSDNAVVGPNSQGNWGTGEGFLVNHNFGGAAAIGQRAAGIFNLQQTATTGNTAAGASYSALAAYGTATANDNGTGVTQSTARGQLETVNFIATLGPSATDWIVVQGGEVDISVQSGASVYAKVGWQITQLATDAVQGSTWDAAEVINAASGAPGWKVGLLFGGQQGLSPFTSSSTAFLADTTVTTIGSVLDFSAATISTNFLNSKQFKVTGAGAITSGANGGSSGTLTLAGGTSGSSSVSVNSTGAMTISAQAMAVDGIAPTSCSVTGAGSGATCSFSGNSNNANGTAIITAAGTPTSSGTLTINFSTTIPGGSVPVCLTGYDNNGTSWAVNPFATESSTSNTVLTSTWNNNGTSLVAASAYRIDYHCFGK